MIKGYASRTGTKRNLAALRAAGWGLLVSATGAHRTEGWEDYGIDSGAWTAYQKGTPFDEDAYRKCVLKLGGAARWVPPCREGQQPTAYQAMPGCWRAQLRWDECKPVLHGATETRRRSAATAPPRLTG